MTDQPTAAPRLTAPQKAALHAAADGQLWQTSLGTIHQAVDRATGRTVGHKTIERIRSLGLIRAGRGDRVNWKWDITDEGRTVIAGETRR